MSGKEEAVTDLMAALETSLKAARDAFAERRKAVCTCPWVDGVLRKGPHCPVHKHKREDR